MPSNNLLEVNKISFSVDWQNLHVYTKSRLPSFLQSLFTLSVKIPVDRTLAMQILGINIVQFFHVNLWCGNWYSTTCFEWLSATYGQTSLPGLVFHVSFMAKLSNAVPGYTLGNLYGHMAWSDLWVPKVSLVWPKDTSQG